MLTIKILRGTTAQNDAHTSPAGTLTLDSDRNQLRVHDGVTQGGHPMPGVTDLLELHTTIQTLEQQVAALSAPPLHVLMLEEGDQGSSVGYMLYDYGTLYPEYIKNNTAQVRGISASVGTAEPELIWITMEFGELSEVQINGVWYPVTPVPESDNEYSITSTVAAQYFADNVYQRIHVAFR